MRIVIIGAGAIGAVTAAYMAMAGEDVTLVCRREAAAEAIRKEGLRVTGRRGAHTVPLHAVSGVTALSGTYDCCLAATKAYDLFEAAKSALPYLAPGVPVVALQNGMCADILISAVGEERAAGAIVTWSCTMHADTHMELTGEGGFILGMMRGGSDARLLPVQKALSRMAPTELTENYRSAMFSKLIINSGITCGGAMAGETLGNMLLRLDARRFFIEIVREDLRVASAMGIRVPPFGGKLDYYRFINGNGPWDRLRRHVTLLIVGLQYWKLRSSSLTSLLRGGRTEVDTLNGWIAQKGMELGVSTPVNGAVARIIKEIEAGSRAITPKNIAEALKG
ncbi:MAG TPA: 2-dehydropantoate 2-reductase [Feifaniaceae bacterium]|nr:2-dehydropantoate 2-reductase [Feifaniaceae bacterium]